MRLGRNETTVLIAWPAFGTAPLAQAIGYRWRSVRSLAACRWPSRREEKRIERRSSERDMFAAVFRVGGMMIDPTRGPTRAGGAKFTLLVVAGKIAGVA